MLAKPSLLAPLLPPETPQAAEHPASNGQQQNQQYHMPQTTRGHL